MEMKPNEMERVAYLEKREKTQGLILKLFRNSFLSLFLVYNKP
jgi:hypothetical protein